MLIINAAESHLVSSLNWIDRNCVWLYCVADEAARAVPLGDAAFLTVHAGREGLFAAVHHYDGSKIAITAHRIEAPEESLARIELSGTHFAFDGERHVWRCLPRAYVANYASSSGTTFNLFIVDPDRHTVEHHRPDWYDSDYEDKTKHGMTGIVDAPNPPEVVVSVQRDHEPVLYDPLMRKAIRRIPLAGRYGNPLIHFRRRASEMWASDFDHLVKVETIDWSVVKAVRLQAAVDPQALFIGDFAFNADESLCAVARPFSGDVLALDTATMNVVSRAAVGGQPYQVVILRDQTVIARDWKTGDALRGALRPI